MTALKITLGLVFSIGLFIWLIFRNKNQKLQGCYAERNRLLHAQLETNKVQIHERSLGLNRYDFLKYNLMEALVIQSEISL